MTDDEKLCALLKAAMTEKLPLEIDKPPIAPLLGGAIRLRHYAKNSYLSHAGQPLQKVMVQLNGSVTVFKYNREGGSARTGISEAPQIYGIYEALNHIEEHTATLQATTPVCCAEVSPALYLSALQTQHGAALYSLYFLAKFTDRMLNRSDKITLNTPYENLLLYLYESSMGAHFPVTIQAKKSEMAELLNLNLRTLYRQLDRLTEENLIQRNHGKIVVTQQAFAKISEIVATL